ncbi:MAG: GNAT family N-acetyltransferase [Candidatus Zixiibacteriota bacterium]
MDLSFRENYCDSPKLKKEFMNYLVQIFGLDLSLWDKMGFWDQRYRPFSYFDGNSIVSSVCVYSMEMTIRGKPCQVAQISAVGTLPGHRKKGLSSQLTQKAMDWARDRHDFFYLFADKDAYPFYKNCGFRLVDEYKPRISVSGNVAHPGSVKLDVQNKDHLERIYRIASVREPVSNVLGVSNKKLFMFWCLYALRDDIYYIPELDVLVLYKRENGLVTIFDIVGEEIPTFEKIYPHIRDRKDVAVEFLFMVDKMKPENIDWVKVRENGTHILGNFSLENTKFIFPLTAQA